MINWLNNRLISLHTHRSEVDFSLSLSLFYAEARRWAERLIAGGTSIKAIKSYFPSTARKSIWICRQFGNKRCRSDSFLFFSCSHCSAAGMTIRAWLGHFNFVYAIYLFYCSLSVAVRDFNGVIELTFAPHFHERRRLRSFWATLRRLGPDRNNEAVLSRPDKEAS